MITRSIEVSRASLKVKIAALAASIAVAAGIMVAPQPAAAWTPGVDDPGYEVGQLVTGAPNQPYWDKLVIGRMYLDRTSWLPGSRLKLTTVIDLSHPSFSPQFCTNGPIGWDEKYFDVWAGLDSLILRFPSNLPDLNIGDVQNPSTVRDRDQVVQVDSRPGSNQKVSWNRPSYLVGDSGQQGETMRAGSYSFTFEAPVGSSELKADKFHTLITPYVDLTHIRKNIPEENPNHGNITTCQFSQKILQIQGGSLKAFGSTTIKAAAKPVVWGVQPAVVATVTSAEGIPAGKVDVAGPHGINGSGTLVPSGADGKATITLPASLPVGTHVLTVTYGGQGQHSAATTTVNLVVSKRKPSMAVKVTKKSKPKKTGKARLTVASPLSTKPSGKVTVTLKKGSKAKSVTGTLRSGTITVTLPKLPKGKWTVTARYLGDARYAAVAATAPKINSK